MQPITQKKRSIAATICLMHRIRFALLPLLMLALFGEAQAQEAPRVGAFANSPGAITIVWEHSGKDVNGFVVERQGPPYDQNAIVAVAVLNGPTRQFTDANMQAATAYNHRVCAVYDDHRTCSDWIRTNTLAPQPSGKPGENQPPATPPPPLAQPVLKATATSTRNIHLEWDYNNADRLTSMALYRDGQFIFDGAIERNFTNSHVDVVPRFNTEYTYKLCFSNPDEKDKCSEPLTVMGTPIAPSAPADVKVVSDLLGGRAVLGGAVRLRPRLAVNVSWRNTDVPGQFITVEVLDMAGPDSVILGGAARTAPRQAWIEATRLSAKDSPTSVTVDRSRSLISTLARLSTYRVCAVVPKMGDAGKVCSQPVSRP